MSNSITAAENAIARSVSHNEIVLVDREEHPGVDSFLSSECDDSVETNDDQNKVEYWGTNEDGDDWRVHVVGSVADLVTVETMPDQHRGSHRAAGNWGVYPHNGAERAEVTREEAEQIIADDADGYAHIVGE